MGAYESIESPQDLIVQIRPDFGCSFIIKSLKKKKKKMTKKKQQNVIPIIVFYDWHNLIQKK
jgi:hypothetical protein